jgi:hypothetical protein
VYISLSGLGNFLVRGGREIIIDALRDAEDRILRLYILGTALGILLNQRGLSVFHASAISISNGAVAFLGEKGHGKSTLAASLNVRGHDLIADDIVVIDEIGDQLMVRPGFPQFKLWPDSLGAIGETSESLPILHPNFEKRSRKVSKEFAMRPIPLRCVFLLDFGEELQVTRLGLNEGLIGIMPHWYGARFNGELLPVFGLATHFFECANIVKKVPIYVLKRPRSLRFISDVAQRIESTTRDLLQAVE